MKKNRSRLILLAIILIFFFGLLIVKDRISKIQFTKPPQPFASIKKNEITQVTIVKDKKKHIFSQKNNLWFVEKDKEEYPADQDRINKIISSMIEFKKEEIASTNKSRHFDFGIYIEMIELKAKDKTYTLYIGKNYTSDRMYVKSGNENEVYLAKGFENAFVPDDYRDFNVRLVENEEQISSVTIESSGKRTVLEKKSNDWMLANKKAKKERVDFFINDLKTLKAKNILKNDTLKTQLTYPSLTIAIKEGGSEKKAEFTLEDITNKTTYYLKTSSPYLYELAAGSVESLRKDQKDFIE